MEVAGRYSLIAELVKNLGASYQGGSPYLQVLTALARELVGGARNHLHPHCARGVGKAANQTAP
mgnify:CR=1 FL=1